MTHSIFQKPLRSIIMQVVIIVFVSGITAGVINTFHPNRILWMQDWSNYVESQAREVNVEVIPLAVALSFHEANSHIFVDARSKDEYENSHIPDAISLPFTLFDEHFHQLEQLLESTKPLVVYCTNRECDDALLLAIELQGLGQTNLVYYVDGFELWEESECPVETQ